MTQVRGVSSMEARPFGMQLDTLRGEPIVANGVSITPIARRLALWRPGGAWVYAWPVAVEYPAGQRIRRARIVQMWMLSLGSLAALALATVAALFAVARRRARA